MTATIFHQAEVVVVYKYEKRIVALLFRIVECCGGIDYNHNEGVCTACKIRIVKCSKLMVRGQIPLLYYVELVRNVMTKSKGNYEKNH
jgi:hypothetical protein